MRDFTEDHGRLGLASTPDGQLQQIARTVQFSLQKQGYMAEAGTDPVAHQVLLTSDVCTIRLTVSQNPAATDGASTSPPEPAAAVDATAALDIGCRVEIRLSDCVTGDAQALLAYLMIDLVRAHNPEWVEWMAAGTRITPDAFLACFDMPQDCQMVAPQRPMRPKPAGAAAKAAQNANGQNANGSSGFRCVPLTNGLEWPDAQVALAQAYRIPVSGDIKAVADAIPSDILRLAAWAIAGVVAFIALPVAVCLFIINLFRGEDFRLNAHVLSVTGLLVVLQSTGAFAEVVALLPN